MKLVRFSRNEVNPILANKLTSANVIYVNVTVRRALGAISARRTRSALALSRLAVAGVAQTSCQVAIARNALAVRKTGRAVIAVGAAFAFSTDVTCGERCIKKMEK